MCGICGLVKRDGGCTQGDAREAAARMSALLERRGPGDQGCWEDPAGRLFLGFPRVAITDHSPVGLRPAIVLP